MRVLVLYRPTGPLGGDTLVAQEYAEALRSLGVDAECRSANKMEDATEFDIVHIYAACSPDWGLPTAMKLKQIGVPFLITPLYWPRDARQAFYGRPGQDIIPGYKQAIAATLRLATAWACVTMSEVLKCWELVPRHRAFVLGRGVTPLETKAVDPDDYVLCLARIEPHKNQVSLARACSKLGVRLECIGPIADQAYATEVVAWGGNVHGEMIHSEAMSWLARANVHALVSFGEIVAGANCEAAAMGIPAVISVEGADPEFFGPGGVYCDPSDWRDIAEAIETAWSRPRGNWAWPSGPPIWQETAKKGLAYMRELLA